MESRAPYIIAEIAYIHEGDIEYLNRMIDEIVEVELNAIKFHMLLEPQSYMQKDHPLLEEVKKWLFSKDEWDSIIDRTCKDGLDIIMLCDDVESIDYLLDNDKAVKAIELHATGLNDYFLLEAASRFKGQVFLGIGGSSLDEIHFAVDFLGHRGKHDVVLMYGFQSYPTNYADINLSKLKKLKEMFHLPVGYADHTAWDDPNNELIGVLAAANGFNILEKHYALKPGVERVDYHAAVGKEHMRRLKELMELTLTVHGSGKLKMSDAELAYGNVGPMKKAIIARKPIPKGEKLSLDNLWFKRTEGESTIRQSQFLQLIGLEAIHDISEDEIIDFSKIKYEFRKPDMKELTGLDGGD